MNRIKKERGYENEKAEKITRNMACYNNQRVTGKNMHISSFVKDVKEAGLILRSELIFWRYTLSEVKSAKLVSVELPFGKAESGADMGLFSGAGGLDGGVAFCFGSGDFGLCGGAGDLGRGGSGDFGRPGGAEGLGLGDFGAGGREGRAGRAPGGAKAPWPNGSSGCEQNDTLVGH